LGERLAAMGAARDRVLALCEARHDPRPADGLLPGPGGHRFSLGPSEEAVYGAAASREPAIIAPDGSARPGIWAAFGSWLACNNPSAMEDPDCAPRALEAFLDDLAARALEGFGLASLYEAAGVAFDVAAWSRAAAPRVGLGPGVASAYDLAVAEVPADLSASQRQALSAQFALVTPEGTDRVVVMRASHGFDAEDLLSAEPEPLGTVLGAAARTASCPAARRELERWAATVPSPDGAGGGGQVSTRPFGESEPPVRHDGPPRGAGTDEPPVVLHVHADGTWEIVDDDGTSWARGSAAARRAAVAAALARAAEQGCSPDDGRGGAAAQDHAAAGPGRPVPGAGEGVPGSRPGLAQAPSPDGLQARRSRRPARRCAAGCGGPRAAAPRRGHLPEAPLTPTPARPIPPRPDDSPGHGPPNSTPPAHAGPRSREGGPRAGGRLPASRNGPAPTGARPRGRPRKLSAHEELCLVHLYSSGRARGVDLAVLFGVGRSTVYRALQRAARASYGTASARLAC
jgi:hypothetical protein